MEVSRSDWWKRWTYSTNAKDIGMLYIYFAIFSGLIGTCLSLLIRIEMGSPGAQILANDNQLYNTIITAHAFLMSAPLCFGIQQSFEKEILEHLYQLKESQTGGIKLHEETQTVKPTLKDENGIKIDILGLSSNLRYISIRITNLIHIVRYKRDLKLIYYKSLCIASNYDIISIIEEKLKLWDIIQSESKNMQGSKYSKLTQGTTGSPKGTLMVAISFKRKSALFKLGDGVIVVRNKEILGRMTVRNRGIRLYSSKAGSVKGMTRGSELNNIPESKFSNVNIKRIANLKNLILAYELIKSKPGNMSMGIDNITLDGISLDYFKKIQIKLRAGKYDFLPARRVKIPKPGKKEKIPLNVGSPRDKIIQKGIQLVMEKEYEKIFLDSSHGFRPNKGTHTAIQYMEAKFQSVHYIIEADFAKAFDSIQHKKLLDIIKENCKCTKTLRIIKSGLKAGYFEFGNIYNNLDTGIAQGSILSPLLCNVYLHELDKYIEHLKKEYNKGSKRLGSEEYIKLQNKTKYMRKTGADLLNPLEYNEYMKKMLSIPSKRHDNSFNRVHYVRYADDFILGVEGSYKTTKEILNKVRNFIENKLMLKLNEDKTRIVKYTENPVEFLGYTIMGPHLKGSFKPIESIKARNSNKYISRRKKIRIRIGMNYSKVINKLELEGFIRKRNSPKNQKKMVYRGTFKGNLINLDHGDILKYYNSKIRGLYNYYNFVSNMNKLAYICWLITESCCLTLARKFKLKSMKKVYRKFGKNFSCVIESNKGEKQIISQILPEDFKKKHIMSRNKVEKDPFKSLEENWNQKFTKSNIFQTCIICGSNERIEMHHVRQIKDLRNPKSKKDFYTRQMEAINRKQIPLCKDHHIRLHNNTWTDTERDKLKDKSKNQKKEGKNKKKEGNNKTKGKKE
jgi:group II intron reverse transcriptase/maturase